MSPDAPLPALRQSTGLIRVQTMRQGMWDITATVASWLQSRPIAEGLLTLLVRHTSASLLLQENADPSVQADLEAFLSRIAPEDGRLYSHNLEGPDDMPAHIRAALTQSQLSIPIIEGRMALGTWQGIYLFEHRRRGREREIALHLIGA